MCPPKAPQHWCFCLLLGRTWHTGCRAGLGQRGKVRGHGIAAPSLSQLYTEKESIAALAFSSLTLDVLIRMLTFYQFTM